MSIKRAAEMAGINSTSCEVRRRRWNWLGFRRRGENDCITALGWRPKGEGKGEDDLEEDCRERTGQGRLDSWSMATTATQNRAGWTDSVMAVCASWRDER